MLEVRSAYGYFGAEGGTTGETPPKWCGCIERRMPYWEYKNRYPECKTMNDYDKHTKTITVLIPEEYAERPNFGNRYSLHEFLFTYSPAILGFSETFVCKAKNYKNALKAAKKWAKENGITIVGDAPGHERQIEYQ